MAQREQLRWGLFHSPSRGTGVLWADFQNIVFCTLYTACKVEENKNCIVVVNCKNWILDFFFCINIRPKKNNNNWGRRDRATAHLKVLRR